MESRPCPLCGTTANADWKVLQNNRSELTIDCKVCGWLTIDSGLLSHIERDEYKDSLYLLSALSRRNFDRQQPRQINKGIETFRLTSETIVQHLESLSIPSDPLDLVDRLLLLVQERTTSFDAGAKIDPNRDYPLLFSRSPAEYDYIRKTASQMGYAELITAGEMKLTPAGWGRIRELRASVVRTKQVFVAMWFNEETDTAWSDGFKPALSEDLGYNPIRIDKSEHINKIDDEIISAIRASGFLVADFTGDRGGVYFEAGFAMGLGKPVVWCCRDDKWAKKLHFDTRQYSHIMWKEPADLRRRLVDRISAVIRPILP